MARGPECAADRPAETPRDLLSGCRVLLTAQRRADELGAALSLRGATIIQAPVMTLVPNVDDPELVRTTNELLAHPPDTVVVTTGVGFRGWMEAADAAGLAGRLVAVLSSSRVIARGPKAHGAIQDRGLNADWVAESETSAEVLDLLLQEGVRGLRIAVQEHGAGDNRFDVALAAAGADVVSLVVYRWGPAPDPDAVRRSVHLTAARGIDAVVFTSAPGVAAFLEAAQEEDVAVAVRGAFVDPTGVLAAAIGPVTAAPLEALGIMPLVPDRFRMGALVRALTHELDARRGVRADTDAGELHIVRGGARLAGQLLDLSPTSLAVLRVLAQAGGSVVTREQLLVALPGHSSNGHAVEMAVARLRQAMAPHDLVSTIVKRGYRLRVRPEGAIAR